MKDQLIRVPSAAERAERLKGFVALSGVADFKLPRHVRALDNDHLHELVANGVQLENHGADHIDYAVYEPDAMREQVNSCRRWLSAEFGQESKYFAVPFGNMLPRFKLNDETMTVWLLQSRDLITGKVGPRLYNRPDLLL
jgi:peptidoglycan/xylan/chitin deacetylase (PgdA/CDA1 family)